MLASVIREIIAPVLRECPSECGVVSITDVEVSADFAHATVYITALKQPELALTFLDKRRSKLQKQVGAIPRAKVPKLRFRIDDKTEQANKIEELLDGMN